METRQDYHNYISGIIKAIREADEIVLFNPEEVEQETIWEHPMGYWVNKRFYYIEGRVSKVVNGTATIVGLGEDWGDTEEVDISELPVESILDIYYDYLVVSE